MFQFFDYFPPGENGILRMIVREIPLYPTQITQKKGLRIQKVHCFRLTFFFKKADIWYHGRWGWDVSSAGMVNGVLPPSRKGSLGDGGSGGDSR